MDFLKFIFYGIIQGFIEFIPVSSTALLKIISFLVGINDPGSSLFAFIQIGSFFAIFWYFRKSIFNFNNLNHRNFRHSFLNDKLHKSIFVGTMPIVLFVGFIKLLFPGFSDSFLRSNLSIALVSILMAIIMLFADISSSKLINLRNHKYSNSLYIRYCPIFCNNSRSVSFWIHN